MPSPRREYMRELNRIERKQTKLEAETIAALTALLLALRRGLADTLLQQDLTTGRLSKTVTAVEALVTTFEAAAIKGISQAAIAAYGNGATYATAPLIAAGLDVSSLPVDKALLNILETFTVDLIKSVSDDLKGKIISQIRLAALGNKTPFEIMKILTDIIGISPGQRQTVKGITYQVERIVRTELNRVFSMANNERQGQIVKQFPDAQKQWIATGDARTREAHLAAHGQIKPINEPFYVGGENMMHPHDPAASAKNTVNCRCRSVTVHPSIGAVITPEDARVAKEKERRDDE